MVTRCSIEINETIDKSGQAERVCVCTAATTIPTPRARLSKKRKENGNKSPVMFAFTVVNLFFPPLAPTLED